jgi:hypothetical protein
LAYLEIIVVALLRFDCLETGENAYCILLYPFTFAGIAQKVSTVWSIA